MADQVVRVGISATDETGPAFAAAQSRVTQFQSSMGSASGSMKEARGAAVLLGEEIGVRMNRHLVTAMASSGALRMALSAAFPLAAAIGFGEVAVRLGEQVKKAFDVISGIQAEDAMIEASAKLEESLHRIAEKTKEAADAYDRLGKSAQIVAVMDKADAAAKQQSAQLQLSSLKSLLVAQEALAQQTEVVLRPRQQSTTGPTDAALAAQEMIGPLKAQIATLENSMTLLQFGTDSAGKKLDTSLTAAFDRAAQAAERAQKAIVSWDHMWNRIRDTSGALLAAPGQGLLDAARLAGGPIQTPDWVSGLSNAQTSPLYSGSREMMNLTTLQDDQNAAIQKAQDIYEQTATKAQKYNDTVAQLNQLLGAGRIDFEQFSAAQAAAGKELETVNKSWEKFGEQTERSILNAAFAKESWHNAIGSIIEDLAQLILKMYVFSAISKAMGANYGGVDAGGSPWASFFQGMGGSPGKASGGFIGPGMWSLVGEKGPELAFGGSSGLSITPNSALGGGVHIDYLDARGADASVEQRIMRLMPILEERCVRRSVAAVQDRNVRR